MLAATLWSCSDESETTPLSSMYYAESPELFFNAVPVSARGVSEVSEGTRCTLLYNNDYRTVDFYLYDFDAGDGTTADYYFKDVPWEFSVGTPTKERVVSVESLTSDSASVAPLTLTDVSIIYYEANELDPRDCRGFAIDFTAGGYRFTGYPTHLCCSGTTLAVEPGVEHVILYTPTLTVDFNPAQGTADLHILDFSTDVDDSGVNVSIAGATAKFAPGEYTLTKSSATVNDSTTIRDFRATGVIAGELTVDYTVVTPSRSIAVSSHLRPNFFDTKTTHSAD